MPSRPAGTSGESCAAHELFVATGSRTPSRRHRLVELRGWPDERYAGWLGRLWVSVLAG